MSNNVKALFEIRIMKGPRQPHFFWHEKMW